MAYEVPSSCFAVQLLKAVDCDLDVTIEEAIRTAELYDDPSTSVGSKSSESAAPGVCGTSGTSGAPGVSGVTGATWATGASVVPVVSKEEIREAVLFLLLQSNVCGYGDLGWLEEAFNHLSLELVLRLMLTYGSVYLNDEGSSWEPDRYIAPEDGTAPAETGCLEASRLNERLRAFLCQRPTPGRDEIRRFLEEDWR